MIPFCELVKKISEYQTHTELHSELKKHFENLKYEKLRMDSENAVEYVLTCIYFDILGYDVQFCHMNIVQLVSSENLLYKRIGYLGVTLFLYSELELQVLLTNLLLKDLDSENYLCICMALHVLSYILNVSLIEVFTPRIIILLQHHNMAVRKRAILCVKRIIYLSNNNISIEQFLSPDIAIKLASDPSPAIVNAICLLLNSLPYTECIPYISCIEPITKHIQLLLLRRVHPGYNYTMSSTQQPLACPWFLLNLLQTLYNFSLQTQNSKPLQHCIEKVLDIITPSIDYTSSLSLPSSSSSSSSSSLSSSSSSSPSPSLVKLSTINPLHISILLHITKFISSNCGPIVSRIIILLQKIITLHSSALPIQILSSLKPSIVYALNKFEINNNIEIKNLVLPITCIKHIPLPYIKKIPLSLNVQNQIFYRLKYLTPLWYLQLDKSISIHLSIYMNLFDYIECETISIIQYIRMSFKILQSIPQHTPLDINNQFKLILRPISVLLSTPKDEYFITDLIAITLENFEYVVLFQENTILLILIFWIFKQFPLSIDIDSIILSLNTLLNKTIQHPHILRTVLFFIIQILQKNPQKQITQLFITLSYIPIIDDDMYSLYNIIYKLYLNDNNLFQDMQSISFASNDDICKSLISIKPILPKIAPISFTYTYDISNSSTFIQQSTIEDAVVKKQDASFDKIQTTNIPKCWGPNGYSPTSNG